MSTITFYYKGQAQETIEFDGSYKSANIAFWDWVKNNGYSSSDCRFDGNITSWS